MDLTTLQQLVKNGESAHLEFKKSTASLRQVGETLCAFLNSGLEGYVAIGVTASGNIVGQEVADSTLQKVAQLLKHFDPEADIELQRIPLHANREVILLRAPSSIDQLPFLFQGRAHQRIGTVTSTMRRERFRHLCIDPGTTSKWGEMPAKGYTLDDLDLELVRRVIHRGIELNRLPAIALDNIPEALEKLDLSAAAQLNNAALVLFGKRLTSNYSQCYLRLARFRGRDKSDFLDHKQLSGNAFQLLEEAEQFVARHIPGKRSSIWLRALRRAGPPGVESSDERRAAAPFVRRRTRPMVWPPQVEGQPDGRSLTNAWLLCT